MKKSLVLVVAVIAILLVFAIPQQSTALPLDCYEAAIFGGAGNGLDCVIAIIQSIFLGGPWGDGGWDGP
jgi:hypothetical protein